MFAIACSVWVGVERESSEYSYTSGTFEVRQNEKIRDRRGRGAGGTRVAPTRHYPSRLSRVRSVLYLLLFLFLAFSYKRSGEKFSASGLKTCLVTVTSRARLAAPKSSRSPRTVRSERICNEKSNIPPAAPCTPRRRTRSHPSKDVAAAVLSRNAVGRVARWSDALRQTLRIANITIHWRLVLNEVPDRTT
jgi:hypothetical protein